MVHRPTKRYSNEFKAHAVEVVRVTGKTATEVAKDLGVSLAALCRWVGQAEKRKARPEGEAEQEELKRLRKEVETLRMERDFLKKAAAFFAKEST